jgi:(E)-4-hydroxy-3-methyl-but-2-enyl pyrophosphate reductase
LKVRLAKTAGFCMGVRRAMEMVLAEANRQKGMLFTYGPLIHNNQVLDLLESKKVRAIDDITGLDKGTLLIRAHGIPPQERSLLKSSNLKIIDATCPRVAKVQAIIRYHAKKGYIPVIVGDRDHAEVIGLVGYGEGKARVINSIDELSDFPNTARLCLVAQTTQNEDLYAEISDFVRINYPDSLIFETICEATSDRQAEVKSLAEHVDGIVVVGGYHSGNTRRLARISEETGTPTFHIETEKELSKEDFSSMETIGITAGASTPNWMIKNVIKEIEAIKGRGETVVERWMKKGFKFLLLSNLLVSMGAFSLSYAAAILSGRNPDIYYPLLTFLYIYAIHVLYRFLDKGASSYNDPERAGFYKRHRKFLIFTSVFAIISALIISYHCGLAVFTIMTGLTLLGIIYSIPIVPSSLRHVWRYAKIKDIPGSKTLLEALAWTIVITLLPFVEIPGLEWGAVTITFFIVFSMAFVRTAFFDVFQVQGDLIVGVETLPIYLGERKTITLLKWIIVLAAAILIIAPFFNLVSLFSLMLIISLLTLSLTFTAYENRRIYPGPLLELLVEGNLFLTGLLGLVWQILQ